MPPIIPAVRRFPFACIWLCVVDALMNGEYPWTYDNDLFGGPDFWGLMHKHWRMCKAGKLQSPINIDPTKLIFDPQLGRLVMSRAQLDADLWNTGQFPLLTMNASSSEKRAAGSAASSIQQSAAAADEKTLVNISGGPAQPYTYQLHQVVVHFGDLRKGERGSEHTIDRVRFPAEVQLLAFNTDLYENFSQAQTQPRGLLAIAIIVDVGDRTNPELKKLTQATHAIRHRNQMARVKQFQPAALLPQTEHYVTYDGSLTFPGCFETVTWVLFNSPIYISADNLALWAELVQSEASESLAKDGEPPVSLSANFRPLKASNGRLIRTNINVRLKGPPEGDCPSKVYVDMGYRSNPVRVEQVLKEGKSRTANEERL